MGIDKFVLKIEFFTYDVVKFKRNEMEYLIVRLYLVLFICDIYEYI